MEAAEITSFPFLRISGQGGPGKFFQTATEKQRLGEWHRNCTDMKLSPSHFSPSQASSPGKTGNLIVTGCVWAMGVRPVMRLKVMRTVLSLLVALSYSVFYKEMRIKRFY